MKKSAKNISLFLGIIFSLALTISAYTIIQNSEGVENAAKKLQQKVLLNDDQTEKVKSILTRYVNNSGQYTSDKIQKEIVSVMDAKQSAKYDIIKSNWWKEVESLLPKK